MAENVALAGYAVNVHLVEIPESEAAQRCVRRLEESGRFVDPAYVLSIGNGPELTYNRIKAEVAIYGYSRWSNDVPHGQLPKNIEISPSDLLSDAG
jgi:hypothetical protein